MLNMANVVGFLIKRDGKHCGERNNYGGMT